MALVTQVKAVKTWLEPEDPILSNISEFTAHFAQEREESTCLWMAPYLARFLKSEQKTLSVSGKLGSGKTILATVINDYLQHPIGGVMYKSIFVSISKSALYIFLMSRFSTNHTRKTANNY
jgi:DNA replication protein DnaC